MSLNPRSRRYHLACCCLSGELASDQPGRGRRLPSVCPFAFRRLPVANARSGYFNLANAMGLHRAAAPLSQPSLDGSMACRPDPKRNHDTDAKAEAPAQGFRCPGPARRASPRLRALAQKLAPYPDFPLIGLRVGPTGLRSLLGSVHGDADNCETRQEKWRSLLQLRASHGEAYDLVEPGPTQQELQRAAASYTVHPLNRGWIKRARSRLNGDDQAPRCPATLKVSST
jgi:hypothetical protein